MISERRRHARALFARSARPTTASGRAVVRQDPRWRRFLVSRLPQDGGEVLDVATGTGLPRRSSSSGIPGHRVDQSLEMLALARQRFSDRVSWWKPRPELPFADRSFDHLVRSPPLRRGPGRHPPWSSPGSFGPRRNRRVGFGLPRGVLASGVDLWVGVGLPLAGRLLSPGWHEVGRFLGPSIRGSTPRSRSRSWRSLARGGDRGRAGAPPEPRRRARGLGAAGCALATGSIPASRPAFYALRPGGWRDYVTLLHLPCTAWHLSYVVVGGCLATEVEWWTLGLTVLAFALAMGVGAHALDELDGRPLPHGDLLAGPRRARRRLRRGRVGRSASPWRSSAPSGSSRSSRWASCSPLYNLELLGGRAHTDLGFGLSGGRSRFSAFVPQTGTFRVEALLAAAGRRLSRWRSDGFPGGPPTAPRHGEGRGHRVGTDGARETLTGEKLVEPYEAALRLLTVSSILVAATLVAVRIG